MGYYITHTISRTNYYSFGMCNDQLRVLTWLTTSRCPLHFPSGWIRSDACAPTLFPERIIHGKVDVTNTVENAAKLGGLNPGQYPREGEDSLGDRTCYMKVLHKEKWTIPGRAIANALVQSQLSSSESERRFNHVSSNVMRTSIKTTPSPSIHSTKRCFRLTVREYTWASPPKKKTDVTHENDHGYHSQGKFVWEAV